MVDIVRCDRPSGKAVPMPRPQCIEEGCTREAYSHGLCKKHYDYERADVVVRICPWDGAHPGEVCPTCGLDTGEANYAQRIIDNSDAVWVEEAREFNARRRKGGT